MRAERGPVPWSCSWVPVDEETPRVGRLSFVTIPFFDVVVFETFLTTALAWRRDKERDKQLMLLAYASSIAAAIA